MSMGHVHGTLLLEGAEGDLGSPNRTELDLNWAMQLFELEPGATLILRNLVLTHTVLVLGSEQQ